MKKIMKFCMASILAISISGVVFAAAMYDEEGVYYSDDTYTTEVGGRVISCWSGATYWGERTGYYKVMLKHKCDGPIWGD